MTGEAIASDSSLTPRPFILFVNNDIGTDEKQFTVHGQTTALGFNFKGPKIGSLQAGGDILFNFLGDRPVLNQSTPFLLRAYGDLKNEQWRFGFGVAPDISGALNSQHCQLWWPYPSRKYRRLPRSIASRAFLPGHRKDSLDGDGRDFATGGR